MCTYWYTVKHIYAYVHASGQRKYFLIKLAYWIWNESSPDYITLWVVFMKIANIFLMFLLSSGAKYYFTSV